MIPFEEIQLAAYYLWLETGREDTLANWEEAEQSLMKPSIPTLPDDPVIVKKKAKASAE